MSDKTKDELLLEMKELQKQLAEKDAKIAEQGEQISKIGADSEGWLVTAPNAMYNGKVYGVQFSNGQAFISKTSIVEAFEKIRMKDGALQRYLENQYPASSKEEKAKLAAEIREREKIPSSQRAADMMRDEFGYRVEYFSAQERERLMERIGQRAEERRQLDAIRAADDRQKELMPPGYGS